MKKPSIGKMIGIAAMLLCLAAAVALRLGAESRATAEPPKTAEVKPALTVTAVTPVVAKWPVKLSATGNVAAWQEASIGSEVNGLKLNEVKVNVGDTVKRGQVLAVFSDVTARADVAQAKAAVAEAEATLAEKKANADRARKSQSPGVMSAQQISEFLTGEQTAGARLESAKAELSSRQIRLEQTQLIAPDDGVISSRTATVGAVISAGQELFRLIRGGRLEWQAEVVAAELPRLKAGQEVTITAAGGLATRGTVRIIAPTVDKNTRNALIYVDIPADAGFKAGMFARGEFNLGESQVLSVPQNAIVQREGFNYAYSIGDDNKVVQLKVEVGRRLADQVEVTAGVEPVARLVAAGTSFLADGDTVRVVDASEILTGSN
jgi:RND family efflux transporter MFP subunit